MKTDKKSHPLKSTNKNPFVGDLMGYEWIWY